MSGGTAFGRAERGVFPPVRKQLGVSGGCRARAVAGGCPVVRLGLLSPVGWSPAAHRPARRRSGGWLGACGEAAFPRS